jgi:hypothetical protein
MNNQELIQEFQKRLVEIYKQEELKCLRGNNSYKIKGKELLVWYTEVTHRNNKPGNKSQFNYLKNIDDLLICSDEIMHFTGLLYFYRPYINNPLNEAFVTNEGYIYPNNQNLEAKRYYMYADVTSEKIYNYWDKIGDLIASFFPDLFNSKEILFSTVIKKIPKEYRSLQSFKWLNRFYKSEFSELNSKRIDVVHYNKTDTTDRFSHIFSVTSKKKVADWVKKRFDLADYYKGHIDFTIEGIYQTLCFLNGINILR